MKIAGILIVIIGAAMVYCSAVVKNFFLRNKQDDTEKTYDMKENIIKLIGVGIAIVGVLMVMFAK